MEDNKNEIHLPVPTATMIASKVDDPYQVAVFCSSGKHGNKMVLPGGRVKVGKQNWLQTAVGEAGEELNIKNITDIKFFCISSNVNRDIRLISIEKFLDGNEKPSNWPDDLQIVGHFTFDVVLTGRTNDELIPEESEAKEAMYLDLRDFNPEEFALDHGQVLVAYVEYLRTGLLPRLDQF